MNSLPVAFAKKKEAILAALGLGPAEYADRSPKGTVDEPIVDLIRQINEIKGLVTTSSCSGRVDVFVEGQKTTQVVNGDAEDRFDVSARNPGGVDGSREAAGKLRKGAEHGDKVNVGTAKQIKTGPAGKGSGHWLFVSHGPVPEPPLPSSIQTAVQEQDQGQNYYTNLCGLIRQHNDREFAQNKGVSGSSTVTTTSAASISLIRLSFSPLILHVLCADLKSHARPLLAAAINAGFRESGVQSLSAMLYEGNETKRDQHSGTMLAIRTAGLTFETVIGRVIHSDHEKKDGAATGFGDVHEALVSEDYLRLCFGVINERFKWNEIRKARLVAEIQRAFSNLDGSERDEKEMEREDKEKRRRRKREEGLKRRSAKRHASTMESSAQHEEDEAAMGDQLCLFEEDSTLKTEQK